MKTHYNCAKCPGYCCSYEHIEVEEVDMKRLAKHLGISPEKARKRFTKKGTPDKKGDEPPRVLRHKKDPIYGTICVNFDQKKRRCGIYEVRPEICRDYPGRKRCGYYEFLRFERMAQEDPELIPLIGR